MGGRHLDHGRPPALDGHHLGHPLGEDASILQGHGAPQRVADDGQGVPVYGVGQGGEVEDELGQAVGAADGPVGIAVAAQVGGVNGVAVGQGAGHEVPAAAMVLAAVDQQQGRLGAVAPAHVVQAQTLGVVIEGLGAFGHGQPSCKNEDRASSP